jgi:very-short-patch-repair endonuclease
MRVNNPMFREEVLYNHPVLRGGRHFTSLGEKILAERLEELGIYFQRQKQLKKEKGYYTVDFFLPENAVVIEFDGHHSHHTPEGKEKDRQRDAYILSTYGYPTLRILPIDLNNRNRRRLIWKIRRFLRASQTR